MDQKDERILEYLEEDGRASYTEIAEEIGVSEGTVRNRVEKMLENDVIEKFTVERGSRGAKAVVMVKLQTDRPIEEPLREFPEEIEVMEVAGEYDLILEVEKPSNREINDLLDEVRSVEGVEDTDTYMVLNQRN